MKTLVKKAALDLIQQNQMTTTLEVKEELIATQPTYFWKQNFISATLAELADNGELVYKDNGTFRIYELPNTVPSPVVTNSVAQSYRKIPLSQRNVVKMNLTDLAQLVQDNAGKFITVVHKKKTTGDKNIMNVQVLKDRTSLGAIKVMEKGQLKTFYPTDLLEVRVKNTVYQLK